MKDKYYKFWENMFGQLDDVMKKYDSSTTKHFNMVKNGIKNELLKGKINDLQAGAIAHHYDEYRAGRKSKDKAITDVVAEFKKYTNDRYKKEKNEMKITEDYKSFIKGELEKAGKSLGKMSDEETKAFFASVDKKWKAKNESIDDVDVIVAWDDRKKATKLFNKSFKSKATVHGENTYDFTNRKDAEAFEKVLRANNVDCYGPLGEYVNEGTSDSSATKMGKKDTRSSYNKHLRGDKKTANKKTRQLNKKMAMQEVKGDKWYIMLVDDEGDERVVKTYTDFDQAKIQKDFDSYVKKTTDGEEVHFMKDTKKYIGEYLLSVVNQGGKYRREIVKGSRVSYRAYTPKDIKESIDEFVSFGDFGKNKKAWMAADYIYSKTRKGATFGELLSYLINQGFNLNKKSLFTISRKLFQTGDYQIIDNPDWKKTKLYHTTYAPRRESTFSLNVNKEQLQEFNKLHGNVLTEALRSVKVTYDDGNVVHTSMAAGLSDKDIKDYFKVGKTFNVGDGKGGDKMAKVKKVEILK